MFKSGVGFLALFGLGWWLLGTSAFGGAARLVAVAAGGAAAIGLMLAARRILSAVAEDPFTPERRRRFYQINGVQWVLIAAVVMGCGRAGAPVLIAPLIALVVGLHFLPLAAVFEQSRLRVQAVLLIAVGAAGLVIWLADGPDQAVRLVVGLAAGLCLWGTAAWTITGTAAAERALTQ
ncbi:hypothetical protein ACIRQP_38510 [Streptomyces sp. NPDC102274]|uniref:hypothetical protein n=1 Tax=Streptomyces sp. NPDC102274 TaxID=3366151 RepID=UPI003822E607